MDVTQGISVCDLLKHFDTVEFVALTFGLIWLPWLTVAWMLRTGQPSVVTTLILVGGFGRFLAAVPVAAAGGDLRTGEVRGVPSSCKEGIPPFRPGGNPTTVELTTLKHSVWIPNAIFNLRRNLRLDG